MRGMGLLDMQPRGEQVKGLERNACLAVLLVPFFGMVKS